MTPEREAQLTQAAVAGDQSALGELLTAHQRRIYNVCLRMLGHRDDAAEITQDTLLKVIQHLPQFNGKSALSTWMIRIAMNLSLSQLRRRQVRQARSLEQPGGRSGPSLKLDGQSKDKPTPGQKARAAGRVVARGGNEHTRPLDQQLQDGREPNPAQRVQQEEMIAHLEAAMDGLADDLRAILVLRDIDEMDYQQIAEVLAIPVGTVKSRLFRARLALRQEMMKLVPADERPASSNAANAGS